MTEQQQQDALDQLSINTLRFLAVDQVEKAKSGHPGAPLGCAPIAYLLYHKLMKYNPTDPLWSDRDQMCIRDSHLHVPVVGVEALGHILGVAQLGGTVERDQVVVIQHNQLAQSERASQRR